MHRPKAERIHRAGCIENQQTQLVVAGDLNMLSNIPPDVDKVTFSWFVGAVCLLLVSSHLLPVCALCEVCCVAGDRYDEI